MLYYADSITDEQGFIYSVDMIRQKFSVPKDRYDGNPKLQALQAYFSDSKRVNIEVYPICHKIGKYRNLIVVDYGTTTMSIGLGYNGYTKEQDSRGFVEYNPNKILSGQYADMFREDLATIKTYCSCFELARFDLAIDVPYARSDLMLFNPTGKKYSLERYSEENKTEMLGIRNADGYIKIYNKALEALCTMDGEKLENLTRIEITSDSWAYTHLCGLLPEVWLCSGQLSFEGNLDKQTLVLVDLLRQVEDADKYLRRLDYRLAKKIKPLVATKKLEVSYDCIRKISDYVMKKYSGLALC